MPKFHFLHKDCKKNKNDLVSSSSSITSTAKNLIEINFLGKLRKNLQTITNSSYNFKWIWTRGIFTRAIIRQWYLLSICFTEGNVRNFFLRVFVWRHCIFSIWRKSVPGVVHDTFVVVWNTKRICIFDNIKSIFELTL